jgi:hypothetical protein
VSVVHLYSLIQRDADKYNGKWDVAEIEKIPMRDVTGKNVIGHFTVRVRFQEDTQGASFPPPMFPLTPPGLFVSSDPRKAPPGPSEAVRLPSPPSLFPHSAVVRCLSRECRFMCGGLEISFVFYPNYLGS